MTAPSNLAPSNLIEKINASAASVETAEELSLEDFDFDFDDDFADEYEDEWDSMTEEVKPDKPLPK
jgi:hypothetical protein